MRPKHSMADDAPAASEPEPTVEVPQRSSRRATARRASTRRATARELRDRTEVRIDAYVESHPQSTAGGLGKALNADRQAMAARRSQVLQRVD